MKKFILALFLALIITGCSTPRYDSDDGVFEYAWEEYEDESEYCILYYDFVSRDVTVRGCKDEIRGIYD